MSGTTSNSGTGTRTYDETANDSCGNPRTQVIINEGKGDKGDAATIAVGSVTMLPAGSDFTVTNSGTSSAAVFDFGVPKPEDAEVDASTVVSTTANPEATLGAVTDAALAAIPESEKGAANGVQDMDANGAIASLTVDSEGKTTYGGTAKIATTAPTGVSVLTLGEYIGNVSATVQGMAADLNGVQAQTSKLSEDGSAYTGDVASASSGWTPDSATSAAPVSNAFQIVASMLAAKETEIEAVQAGVAGINSDLTGINSAVSGLTTKTVDLSADGSKYSGDITTAHATAATGAKVAGSIMAETIAVVIPAIATKITNLSTDGTTFAGAVTGDVTKAAVTPTGSEATTLGDAIAELGNAAGGLVTGIMALETKTSALFTDGKTFMGAVSGDVTAATITLSGQTLTLPNALSEIGSVFNSDINTLADKTADLSADGSAFSGSVSSATVTDPTTGKSGTLDAALGNMFTNPNAIVVDTGDDSVLVATADDFKRHSMFYIPVIQTSSSFKLPAIKDSTVAGYITVACAVSVPVTAADGSAVTTLTNGTYIIGADGSQSALVISQISDSAPDLKYPAA